MLETILVLTIIRLKKIHQAHEQQKNASLLKAEKWYQNIMKEKSE